MVIAIESLRLVGVRGGLGSAGALGALVRGVGSGGAPVCGIRVRPHGLELAGGGASYWPRRLEVGAGAAPSCWTWPALARPFSTS